MIIIVISNSNNSSVTHHITSTGDTIDISLPTPTLHLVYI